MRKDKANGAAAERKKGPSKQAPLGRPELPSAEASTDPAVAEARVALKWLQSNSRKSFEQWEKISRGILVGSRETEEKTGAKAPSSKYNEAFGHWLDVNGFKSLRKNKAASKLLWIAKNLDEIKVWRSKQTPVQRALWNAPSTIYRVAHCRDRGLPQYRELKDGEKQPGKNVGGADIDTQEKWEGRLYILACKMVGAAEDLKELKLFEPPEPGLVLQVRDAAKAWTRIRKALAALERSTGNGLDEAAHTDDAAEVADDAAPKAAGHGTDAEHEGAEDDGGDLIRVPGYPPLRPARRPAEGAAASDG
jgi:hypothetical protein